ncbi:DUF4190 domain-containing protein [Agromyces soli]
MTDPKHEDPAFTPATIDFGAATSSTEGDNPAMPQYVDEESRMPVPAKTNALAVVSLFASIVGLLTGIGLIVGIVCGHIALSQIKKRGEQGRGSALAGLIIGYVGLVLGIIILVVFGASFAALLADS